MKGKIRSVNQDSDCSDSDSDVASVKTLNAFVNGVASKKDKQMVKCISGLFPSQTTNRL